MSKKSEAESFEDKVSELENIVRKLESGKLSLEQSLEEFQKGIGLYRDCNNYLKKADGEIKAIIEDKEIKIDLNELD